MKEIMLETGDIVDVIFEKNQFAITRDYRTGTYYLGYIDHSGWVTTGQYAFYRDPFLTAIQACLQHNDFGTVIQLQAVLNEWDLRMAPEQKGKTP